MKHPEKMNGLQNIWEARVDYRKIVYNAIKTPDGTVLESNHHHDYKTYVDSNGKTYMIDGGKEYVRSSANGDEVYLTIYSDDEHETIRKVFKWGTYGKSGTEPLTWKPLNEMTDEHINAILDTQYHISEKVRTIFIDELNWRNQNNANIKESPDSI